MLVLTRKKEQVLWVGDIKIQICGIDGNQVKIGIVAPPYVQIVRDEIKDQPRRKPA